MARSTIDLLNVLGKKWDASILEEINNNKNINFDKLLSLNSNIYPKTLNKALNDLIKRGLVTKRMYYDKKQKRSEYNVTESGIRLLSEFESFKTANCKGRVAEIKPCGECEQGPNGNNH